MRQCPTLPGDERALIAHTISGPLCLERQREFYHKCHRCVFRGKPADFAPQNSELNGVAPPSSKSADKKPGAPA